METGANALIAAGGTKLYSISTGGVATDITGAASLTSNLKWAFVTAPVSGGQGPLYGMNGTNTPKYWIGSGSIADWTATVGSVPNGTMMCYAQNKIFVAGVAANPSRLFWCDIGNPRSWTATNVVDLDPNDGQTITGLASLGPYLFVFKQKKIFVVYDLATGANRALSTTVGCVAPRSIAESAEGLFFLSADEGVMIATPSKLTNVSDNVRNFFEGLDPIERSQAAGVVFKNHYYLSAASFLSTTCDMVLDYDMNVGSWWRHSNNASQFAIWRPAATGAVELYAAQDSQPIVDKCYVDNVWQDNGSNYSILWTGPWLSFKAPYLRKRVRQIHVDGRGSVDLYIGRDFFDSTSLLKQQLFGAQVLPTGTLYGDAATSFGVEGVYGDPVFRGEGRVYSVGVNRAFSVEFRNTTNTDMEIDAYTLAITPRKN
jgi:hypothetical protein